MNLNEIAKEVHETAIEKGWWNDERNTPECIALMHSELSEALEEFRNDKPYTYEGENGKPEGVAVELADCIIRILDYTNSKGIDMDEVIRKKMDYNKSRPYRHGNKMC